MAWRAFAVFAAAVFALAAADSVRAQCVQNGTTVNCGGVVNNPGDGFGTGAENGLTINVLGGASLTGGNSGIFVGTDNIVDNHGTIAGLTGAGVEAVGDIVVRNDGSISGLAGVAAVGVATVVNSGTISASDPLFGPGVVGLQVNVTNSGTIVSADTGILAGPLGGSTVVNSGWIVGSFASIDFTLSGGDTLTLLPGSRLVGSVELGQFNAPSTINIQTGSDIGWLITFGACGCGGLVENQSVVNFFGGAPAVVVGNQIATLDPTAFGLADRNLMDFTGWISSLLAGRFGEMGTGNIGVSSFAPEQSPVAAVANDAFASVAPAQAYAAEGDAGLLPNATVVSRESGIAVWTKAFAGAASYGADGPMLPASSAGYGGAFGIDKQITPVLRAGAFIGAGFGTLDVDRDSQTIDSDYVFGGLYGRFDWTSHFLDIAVTIGRSSNDSERLVADNMAAGGLESATASYDGWFVSPELAYGVRIPVNANMIVTPTARVRYLGGRFDEYSENGSAQTLSVGERELSDIEERLELAFTLYEPASAGIFKTRATVGALAFQRLGDDTIDTVLIGQNLSFTTPGDDSSVGAYAGLDFDYRLSAVANLYAGIEGRLMSNDTQSAVAHAGVRVRF